jgi:hypothetical protein
LVSSFRDRNMKQPTTRILKVVGKVGWFLSNKPLTKSGRPHHRVDLYFVSKRPCVNLNTTRHTLLLDYTTSPGCPARLQ